MDQGLLGISCRILGINRPPNFDSDVSKKQFVRLFSQADKRCLMSTEEHKQYLLLSETLTLYRGVTSYIDRNIKTLSQTLDRDKVEWFAHRFDEDGTVYEAEIDKNHAFAFFTSRNEAEVVVNSAYLQSLNESEYMENGLTIWM